MSDQSRVFTVLAQVAQAEPDASTRDELLSMITRSARESIAGAHAVSISVKDPDEGFVTLAPTQDLSVSADKLQYELGEGPCVDAAGGQMMIRTGDIYNDTR